MIKMFEKIRFDEKGLVPAIIQDERTKQVLVLCYMNKDALAKTLREGIVYLFRRSKGKVMMKGETSGCVQKVKGLYIDCEGNSLLFKVNQVKAACHDGYFTCYFRKMDRKGNTKVTGKRIFDPKKVYPVRKKTAIFGRE